MLRLIWTIFSDLKYIWLNCFVRYIPCWKLRRFLYVFAGMKIGKGCRIGIGTVIVRPKGIILGNGCIVNEYCHLDGRGGIKIGDNSSISIYSKIISASHNLNSDLFDYESGNVEILDHVFIGAGAIILENTFIESGAVIGAGSIAKGHFESNTIYVGNPIKPIKSRQNKCDYVLKHNAYFR